MEDPSQLLAKRVKTLCEHVERLNKQVAELQDENARLVAEKTLPTPPPIPLSSPPPSPPIPLPSPSTSPPTPPPSPVTPPILKRLNAL